MCVKFRQISKFNNHFSHQTRGGGEKEEENLISETDDNQANHEGRTKDTQETANEF